MDKKHKLDKIVDTIVKVFVERENKYEAHLKCYPILHRMAEDDEIIFEVFRRNLENGSVFQKSNCTPDFQLTLINRPECFLFVNFFGPNAEKRTDITYSTMHHHDDYLLSTINAKGEGYSSLIFQQGYEIDKENMKAKLGLEKYVIHKPRHIEFIDCHTAHAIFYPKSTTMTYGLWSTHYPTSQTTKIKENKIIKKNKALIKKALKIFNANPKSVGVQQYREDYFYPEDGTLHFLEGQVKPAEGNHYVQNFFDIATNFLGFADNVFLKGIYSKRKDSNIKSDDLIWVEKAIENDQIPRNYESYDMYVPKRNVSIDEYKNIYKF